MSMVSEMIKEAPTLQSICQKHLEELSESSDFFMFAILASEDGFPIAQVNIEQNANRKAAAMASTLSGLAASIVKEFKLGALEGTILECEFGLVLCRNVYRGQKTFVLLSVVNEKATIGQALWSIKNTAKQINDSINV